ncbi:MAG: tRNA glutamyl-Q(34) synthetase GluQRS [Bacteroidetes bacterium]|jgi:glutamyl-Q tRNA(Asp) synthetase|nr:tRNA glutamyl-Q(34) synthetase GluQRS [Bacteroidota bacterium]
MKHPPITRFAPSPTGELHLGHAYSAAVAQRLGDGFILRIDDIDHTRCRPHFVQQIYNDLQWLGLAWRGDPVFQSTRIAQYAAALETLKSLDLVYPCYLTRRELAEILSAPHTPEALGSAPPDVDENILSPEERGRREASGQPAAWRLRTRAALAHAGPISWHDSRTKADIDIDMGQHGDVVIARRDIAASYHLSVVVDDHLDGVTLVTRGADLYSSTHVHRLLQAVLDISPPTYFHHDLIKGSDGIRLAKRNKALSLKMLREEGLSADDVFKKLLPLPTPP